jgi:hypothetical protein
VSKTTQLPPVPQPCHKCEAVYAGSHCPLCKEERPAFTALKNITAQQHKPVVDLAAELRARLADDTDVARIARACGAV